jgi:SAM-dependent methyltransferase
MFGVLGEVRGLSLTAMDLQPRALKMGVQLFGDSINGNKINWVTGDLHSIPLPNNSFDAVYSARVFQHLHDPVAAVGELLRVLKPGGKFCLFLQNRLCPLNFRYYAGLHSPNEVRKWFADRPITVDRCVSMDFYPGPSILPKRLRMGWERFFECLPILNQFGGKVLITGNKS